MNTWSKWFSFFKVRFFHPCYERGEFNLKQEACHFSLQGNLPPTTHPLVHPSLMTSSPLVHIGSVFSSHPCLSPHAPCLCLSDQHLTSAPVAFSSVLHLSFTPSPVSPARWRSQRHPQYANHVLSCICCASQWLPVERIKPQTPFKL